MRRRTKQDATTRGALRVDSRTTALAPRLRPGDIAVLDQVDLDGPTAETLLRRGVAAVVNVSPSTTGRYPNLGPSVLVGAGVPLLDDVGSHVLSELRDGRSASIDGDTLLVEDERVACGTRHDVASVEAARAHARAGTAAQLADVTANASGFLLQEKDALLDGVGVPRVGTCVSDRAVVLVGPAYGAAVDLERLRRFVRRRKAFVVGVDGGADVVLAAGHRLDLAVGDAATMSDDALRAAGHVVLRTGGEGRERVHDLAVPVIAFATRAAAEDMALMLVREAPLVVLVGVPRTLEELLDRGREAASSSLLTRFSLGSRLVPPEVAATIIGRRPLALAWLCLLLALALTGALVMEHDQLLARWHELVG